MNSVGVTMSKELLYYFNFDVSTPTVLRIHNSVQRFCHRNLRICLKCLQKIIFRLKITITDIDLLLVIHKKLWNSKKITSNFMSACYFLPKYHKICLT